MKRLGQPKGIIGRKSWKKKVSLWVKRLTFKRGISIGKWLLSDELDVVKEIPCPWWHEELKNNLIQVLGVSSLRPDSPIWY